MTAEWASKAEGDYDAVCILRRSRKPSRFDAICFHCHQCAEKYLKARLSEAKIRFAKTHDLALLLRLTAAV
jgi:HEPN domain-containing protein